jgi:hypothetical protein
LQARWIDVFAAAEAAGCSRILSEDLSHGTSYFGITVEKPFATFDFILQSKHTGFPGVNGSLVLAWFCAFAVKFFLFLEI